MIKPRLLDVCCGGGGAGVGYFRAGFDVTGIDIKSMLDYPFCFLKREGLDFIRRLGHRFDVIHVSPPCQAYSVTRGLCKPGAVKLIDDFTCELRRINKPWVIENVPGSHLDGIMLCGSMFGLGVKRHRFFASNVLLFQPVHFNNCEAGDIVTLAGHGVAKDVGRVAMGINWNMKVSNLTQAIPPAYTKYIGIQLIQLFA